MEHHGENPQQAVIAVIPARYSSVRLPGKLLLPIAGKPLILHTVQQARQAETVSRVIVATDDQRVFDVVSDADVEVVMTSSEHRSGTDRVAAVAADLPDEAIIVNVQGDEPIISPRTIDAAVRSLIEDASADMATTAEPISGLDELLNGNVVKVVTGDAGYAIYFSRSPMPYPRDAALRHGDPNIAIEEEPELISIFRKHTGLYVYRREYLLKLSELQPTRLESIEMLEQLRALEHGARIRVVEADGRSIGVDTQEDYERVRKMIENGNVSIRNATAADVPQIAKVHVESWQRSFEGIAPADYLGSLSVERRKEVFGARMQDPSYRLLVAENPDKGVVGFIDFGTPAGIENYGFEARVYSFYLLPEFQRCGLGRRLFESCFDAMASEGYRSVCLDTLEMSPYRGFYEKNGGRIVAHDSHSLGDQEFATVIYGWEDLGR